MGLIKKDSLGKYEHIKSLTFIKDCYLIVFSDINLEKRFIEMYPEYSFSKTIVSPTGGINFYRYFLMPKNKFLQYLYKYNGEKIEYTETDFAKIFELDHNQFPTIDDFLHSSESWYATPIDVIKLQCVEDEIENESNYYLKNKSVDGANFKG